MKIEQNQTEKQTEEQTDQQKTNGSDQQMEFQKVDDRNWLYNWKDDLGVHSYSFKQHLKYQNEEPGKIENFKYVEKQVPGKNTRIYFGKPDVRVYSWNDNFGKHKYEHKLF